jgi:hypothetical protein
LQHRAGLGFRQENFQATGVHCIRKAKQALKAKPAKIFRASLKTPQTAPQNNMAFYILLMLRMLPALPSFKYFSVYIGMVFGWNRKA